MSKSAAARLRCRGFVGEGSRPAAEFHCADFPWEELREEGEAAVARQRAELAAHLQQQGTAEGSDGASSAAGSSSGGGSCGDSDSDGSVESVDSGGSDGSWERFHAQQGATARFFKEKR